MHGASIPREDDGAVRFYDLIRSSRWKFVGTLQWTVDAWVNFLANGGEEKNKFQYGSNLYSSDEFQFFKQFRDIHEVVLLIHNFRTMYCCPMTLPRTATTSGTISKCTPLSNSRLIPGGKKPQKGQAVSVLHSCEPGVCSTRFATRSSTSTTKQPRSATTLWLLVCSFCGNRTRRDTFDTERSVVDPYQWFVGKIQYCPHKTNLLRFTGKAGSMSVRLVFETR